MFSVVSFILYLIFYLSRTLGEAIVRLICQGLYLCVKWPIIDNISSINYSTYLGINLSTRDSRNFFWIVKLVYHDGDFVIVGT